MSVQGEASMRRECVLVNLLESRLRYLLGLGISLPLAWFYVGVPQLLTRSSDYGFPWPLATGAFADFAFWSSTLFAISTVTLTISRTTAGRGYALTAFTLGGLAGPYVVIILGGTLDEILSVALGPLGLAEAYAIAISAAVVALIGVFLWGWRQVKPRSPSLRSHTT